LTERQQKCIGYVVTFIEAEQKSIGYVDTVTEGAAATGAAVREAPATGEVAQVVRILSQFQIFKKHIVNTHMGSNATTANF
jgi:hypothetical protein